MSDPVRVGILGAGMIASVRWGVLPGMSELGGRVEVGAIASRTRKHAEALAVEWRIPRVAETLEDLLSDPSLDAIVNLTPMSEHFNASRRILSAGKHLVTEKPISGTVEEADQLVDLAAREHLLIVASPPRMREPATKRAKALVESGAIGHVAFARVRSSNAGPAARAWPTDPRPLYAPGAGPLLDMGVYGLHEITGILGPAQSVSAVSGRTVSERRAVGGAFDGVLVPVGVDDNVIVTIDFGEGVFAIVDCTFNVLASRSPRVELFGSQGTIAVHDVQTEGPRVERYRLLPDGVSGEWVTDEGPDFGAQVDHTRALGRAMLLEDLADAIEGATQPVLSAQHARHVLEIMVAAAESATSGTRVAVSSTF